ncbi:MAG: hypothetical protein INQ03_17435 [Candidatus Heimdallarchaeota archaeon]|nr:hypothetical protein [Candidatus Heimdallarchaeota archaeon]
MRIKNLIFLILLLTPYNSGATVYDVHLYAFNPDVTLDVNIIFEYIMDGDKAYVVVDYTFTGTVNEQYWIKFRLIADTLPFLNYKYINTSLSSDYQWTQSFNEAKTDFFIKCNDCGETTGWVKFYKSLGNGVDTNEINVIAEIQTSINGGVVSNGASQEVTHTEIEYITKSLGLPVSTESEEDEEIITEEGFLPVAVIWMIILVPIVHIRKSISERL